LNTVTVVINLVFI